jgi:hypothetical protein
MYDKIVLVIPADQIDNPNYSRLRFLKIKNFKIRTKNDGSILIYGSLAKFYIGENITPLPFDDVKKALDKLGKLSGCNIYT